jgi:uncharacterized protein
MKVKTTLDKDLTPKLAELADAYKIVDIYVFGSRAKEIAAMVKTGANPNENSTSDVDIAIRPAQAIRLSIRDIVQFTLSLEEALRVNRVDLMILPKADPFLALEAIRGELLYTRNAIDQARYELYVLRRAGDLAPFKRARMELIMGGHGR